MCISNLSGTLSLVYFLYVIDGDEAAVNFSPHNLVLSKIRLNNCLVRGIRAAFPGESEHP